MPKAKYKKGSDGYWKTRVWDGTYTGRNKHYITIRSKVSSKDLEEKVADFRRQVQERRSVRDSGITFIEYARDWAEIYKGQKQINTKVMYERIIEKKLTFLPASLRLQDVDRIHLQKLLNHTAGKPRTQQQIYMTFRQILLSAVADHLFPANVAEEIFRTVDRPRYTPGEKRPLLPHEKAALFSADFSVMDRAFIFILYGCGLRRGEALALTIFDIKDDQVTVSKAHAFDGEKPVQKAPKSANGYRTVPIPKSVSWAISECVRETKANGGTYLFHMRDGEPMTRSSYQKMWRRILREMNKASDQEITGLTAHVLRHNYCTELCYQIPKISIKLIARLLGDTEKMVLEVYNHIVMEKEDSAGAINAAL